MAIEAPPPSEAGLPSPGDVVGGKYKIERLVGRGGMGAVFAANDELLYRRVALKLLLGNISSHPEAVARFLNEARAAARIESEHICRVLDVNKLADSATPYMVLEYLEGRDLSQELEVRGPLPVVEAVDYLLQALDAVAAAHVMGIIHRDLKPANLFLVSKADGTRTVKVLDFGISKTTNPLAPDSGGMTSTKAMLGSPYYMSPEQLRSSKSVDARTDIWALGIILFEALTGAVPFKCENLGELFASILEQDVPPLRSRRPELPPEIEQIVQRCLQRKVEHRFANVGDLGLALAPWCSPAAHRALDHLRQRIPALPRPTSVSPQQTSAWSPAPQGPPPGTTSNPFPLGNTPNPYPSANTPNPYPPGNTPNPYAPGATPTPFVPGGAASSNSPSATTSMGTPPTPVTTAGGWGGQTDPDAPVVPKNNTGLIVALAAGAVLLVGLGAGVALRASRQSSSKQPVASASVSSAPTPPPSQEVVSVPFQAGAPPVAATASVGVDANPPGSAVASGTTKGVPPKPTAHAAAGATPTTTTTTTTHVIPTATTAQATHTATSTSKPPPSSTSFDVFGEGRKAGSK